MKVIQETFDTMLIEYGFTEDTSDEKSVVSLMINYYGIVNTLETFLFEVKD